MTNVISISAARSQLPALIERVNKYFDRFLITVNGKPKAAVLSLEELESLEETAEILAIPGARESIKKGMMQIKKRHVVSFKELKKN